MPFLGVPVLQIDSSLAYGNFSGTLIDKDDVTNNSRQFCLKAHFHSVEFSERTENLLFT